MDVRVAERSVRLGRKIGQGSFGDVYLGTRVDSGEEVAVKLEPKTTEHKQLMNEWRIYRTLSSGKGILNVRWYGTDGDYNVLVMDLLGPSLEDLFNLCGRKFSLKTTLMLVDQMLGCLEFVHSKG